jgi:hypothetical protein
LTTIVNVHHNLVAFGVRAEFLVPSQPKATRDYMSPTTACEKLKQSAVFSGDTQVAGFACDRAVLEPAGLPGAHLWTTPKRDRRCKPNRQPKVIDPNSHHYDKEPEDEHQIDVNTFDPPTTTGAPK